jgi:hypothetical protein
LAGREKRGVFRIVHGTGCLARCMIRWSRLPQAACAAATRLRIIAEKDGECWERQFDSQSFTTLQWAEDGGLLVERFGSWELRFALRADGAALVYEQRGARLCLGPLRLPMPPAFAPQVKATESCDGPARVHVAVTVTLPFIGLLIGYDGHLDVEAIGG